MNDDVVLIAASYHWKCPECGQDNYERYVAERVTCPHCGSIFPVRSIEHRFRDKEEGSNGQQLILL